MRARIVREACQAQAAIELKSRNWPQADCTSPDQLSALPQEGAAPIAPAEAAGGSGSESGEPVRSGMLDGDLGDIGKLEEAGREAVPGGLRRLGSGVKYALGLPFRLVSKSVKILMRPILARIRAYFTAELRTFIDLSLRSQEEKISTRIDAVNARVSELYEARDVERAIITHIIDQRIHHVETHVDANRMEIVNCININAHHISSKIDSLCGELILNSKIMALESIKESQYIRDILLKNIEHIEREVGDVKSKVDSATRDAAVGLSSLSDEVATSGKALHVDILGLQAQTQDMASGFDAKIAAGSEPVLSEIVRLNAQTQDMASGVDAKIAAASEPILTEIASLNAQAQGFSAGVLGQLGDISHALEAQSAKEASQTKLVETLVSSSARAETYAGAASRRVAVSDGHGALLVRTEVGYVLVDSTDHALVAILMEQGDLEPGTRHLIQALLKPDSCYVDVGANIGMHVLAAGQKLRGVGKIICVEPYAPTARLLRESLWVNGLAETATLHELAVSDKSGQANLYLAATCGHHSLLPITDETESDYGTVSVRTARFDEIIPASQKIDLLKVDVEGKELDVIRAAEAHIRHNKNIGLIVEFGPTNLEAAGVSPTDWLREMKSLGLEWKVINPQTGVPESWSRAEMYATESANLLLAAKDADVWERAECLVQGS